MKYKKMKYKMNMRKRILMAYYSLRKNWGKQYIEICRSDEKRDAIW
jgi:hypothetical protein